MSGINESILNTHELEMNRQYEIARNIAGSIALLGVAILTGEIIQLYDILDGPEVLGIASSSAVAGLFAGVSHMNIETEIS